MKNFVWIIEKSKHWQSCNYDRNSNEWNLKHEKIKLKSQTINRRKLNKHKYLGRQKPYPNMYDVKAKPQNWRINGRRPG